MRWRQTFLGMICGALLLASPVHVRAQGCQVQLQFVIPIAIPDNNGPGVWYEWLPVPTSLGFYYDEFSTGPCNSGKFNCQGEDHDWFWVTVPDVFSIRIKHPFQPGDYYVTMADVDRYYDLKVYNHQGWVQQSPATFARNCHGFTFDKSYAIRVGTFGVGTYCRAGQSPPCHPYAAAPQFTKYGMVDNYGHSAKLGIVMCQVQGVPYPYFVPKAVYREEKNGSSGVYKYECTCEEGLDARFSLGFENTWTLYSDP